MGACYSKHWKFSNRTHSSVITLDAVSKPATHINIIEVNDHPVFASLKAGRSLRCRQHNKKARPALIDVLGGYENKRPRTGFTSLLAKAKHEVEIWMTKPEANKLI